MHAVNDYKCQIKFTSRNKLSLYEYHDKNNHNARITNFEKEHYKQGRVNLEDG